MDNDKKVMPTEATARKAIPIWSGFINYFPLAMVAVAECSMAGNEQHNPGSPLHWDRSKSGDEKDACARHLMEAGTIDTDGIRHSTKAAWRAMANLQKELEGLQVDDAHVTETFGELPQTVPVARSPCWPLATVTATDRVVTCPLCWKPYTNNSINGASIRQHNTCIDCS